MYNKKTIIDALRNLGNPTMPKKTAASEFEMGQEDDNWISAQNGVETPIYKKVKVAPSSIEGKGLFAEEPIRRGDVIGVSHIRQQFEKGGETYTAPFPSTVLGYYNHSEEPNVREEDKDSHVLMVAIKDIQPGEEITSDYNNHNIEDLETPDNFKKGGAKRPKLPKKKNSRGYSRSLEATNKFFTENSFFAKPKSRKNKVYDPNAKYYQDGGFKEEDKLKQRLLNRYPGFKKALGTEGENLHIIADPNFKASEHGYGDIEVMFPNVDQIEYTSDYTYKSPFPGDYVIPYNPNSSVNKGDIFLDMLHLLRNDEGVQPYYEMFKTAALDRRGEDLMGAWDEEKQNPDFLNALESSGEDAFRQFENNYIDGLLRSELARKGMGRRTSDKGYKLERSANSPEMRKAANEIYKYLKTKEKGGFTIELSEDEIKQYVDGGYIVEDISVPQLTQAKDGGALDNAYNRYNALKKKMTSALNYAFTDRDLEELSSLEENLNSRLGDPLKNPKSNREWIGWEGHGYDVGHLFLDYGPLYESNKSPILPTRKPQVETPDIIPSNYNYTPKKPETIRTASRSQTVMEPDPNRPGKFKVKEIRSVPYSANFPEEGWLPMNAPQVMYYNPTTEEETEKKFQRGGLTKASLGKIVKPVKPIVREVIRSNYNPITYPLKSLAEGVAKQSNDQGRTVNQLAKYLFTAKGKVPNYFGEGWGGTESLREYGIDKRDLLANYFRQIETGFEPINYDFSADPGLESIIQEYGPLKAFKLNSEIQHGAPVDIFSLNFANLGFNNEFGFENPYNFFGNEGRLIDPETGLQRLLAGNTPRALDKYRLQFPEQIQQHSDVVRNRLNTLFDQYGQETIPFEMGSKTDYTPQFSMIKNPVQPIDDIAGHMMFLRRNANKEFDLTTRDLWGFRPKAYNEKYGLNSFMQRKQSQLVDALGKPFVLTQTNPLKFKEGGTPGEGDCPEGFSYDTELGCVPASPDNMTEVQKWITDWYANRKIQFPEKDHKYTESMQKVLPQYNPESSMAKQSQSFPIYKDFPTEVANTPGGYGAAGQYDPTGDVPVVWFNPELTDEKKKDVETHELTNYLNSGTADVTNPINDW